jgi:hypothetical protein
MNDKLRCCSSDVERHATLPSFVACSGIRTVIILAACKHWKPGSSDGAKLN